MDCKNIFCAVLCFLVLLAMTGLSALHGTPKGAEEFTPINCTTDSDCDRVCFQHETLFSRCDSQGCCVCDCSNTEIANSSYPGACGGRQPDGYWRDQCDKYCNQEYLRPFRYCNNSFSQFYCTCVCVIH